MFSCNKPLCGWNGDTVDYIIARHMQLAGLPCGFDAAAAALRKAIFCLASHCCAGVLDNYAGATRGARAIPPVPHAASA
eukprot:366485-Chlamydomonas_euryale.AAC.13